MAMSCPDGSTKEVREAAIMKDAAPVPTVQSVTEKEWEEKASVQEENAKFHLVTATGQRVTILKNDLTDTQQSCLSELSNRPGGTTVYIRAIKGPEGVCLVDIQPKTKAIGNQSISLKKQQSHNQNLTRIVFALIFALVLLCGAVFGVSIGANEVTKEVHVGEAGDVSDDILMNSRGEPVRTKQVLSYSTLWDLPKFNIAELAHVDKLAVKLKSGGCATFHVGGIIKHSATVAEFFLDVGGSIKVDSGSENADLTVHGKSYAIVGRARRLEAVEANAQEQDARPMLYARPVGLFSKDSEAGRRLMPCEGATHDDLHNGACDGASAEAELVD